jgi:hypothetical protein
MAHMLSNDSTRFRKACIFTTLTLRENTCTIASGDYSTPVSQRTKADFAGHLFDELGLNKREAKDMVELFFEEVKNLRQSRRLENVNRSKRVKLCTT